LASLPGAWASVLPEKSMEHYDLICIGSGPAGQRAAVQAAKLRKKVAVVEKRLCFGGVCIETGTIPSKTFREAVLSFVSLKAHSQNLGFRAERRPTMGQLVARVAEVIQLELEVVRDQLGRNDVELLNGHATLLDPNTVRIEAGDKRRDVCADQILIAVGTTPCDPPGIAPDGRTIITSDGVMGLPNLPRTMTVVGGGVIGVEYASMFAQLGVQVTLVDRRPRPLELMDSEIVDELVHQMRNNFVTFRGGEAVEAIEIVHDGHKKGVVRLESGKHIVSDVVLYCAGRQAATAGLGLERVGLQPDERGRVTVDASFRTAVPSIFAAGDVIGFPALAATSSEQGRLAACHMFGVEARPMKQHFPIGIYAIPEISMVGATEETLTKNQVPYETGVARYREIARGQILGDDSGLFKMIFHRDDRRLLGVHCIGSGATELVHVGQAVLALGGGLDYFLETVFNYPTLAECYKVAAFNAANKLRSASALRQVSRTGS
jgi:NAD(P) transhydrogenase